MTDISLLYLSKKDVEEVGLSMTEIIDVLDLMFKEKGEGRVEMPPKPGIHTRKDAFIHAMPAYIPSLKSAGMKWISGYPENQQKKLPYINGLLILNDPDTGIPTTIMDGTWITAQRTGAATAIAAKYLARKDSSSAGIIACGIQGRSNLEALACIFDLTTVKVFDIFPEVAEKFAREMGVIVGVDIEVVSDPKDAVLGLDLVVTSGPILKNPDPVIDVDWLAEGAFASLVDFDSYWKADALRQADKLATDDIRQMGYYREAGYFKNTPEAYADLGDIVTKRKVGRETEQERIISINLGLALDDMATAILIYNKALEKNIGTQLPL
ncbi:MAG: ornithine cyclodeaminase family protein [Lentisphaeria bacterium]|nr:ornithine cyclodeaminase family protein [Lentisphaeria bacterium]NQZ68789.1 ornithine cyclodeaminase family protein [Lentisphaeria bacterium]